MGRPTLNYPHGDSGSRPADGTDFQAGDTADPQIFDWLFDTLPSSIDALSAEFDELDSDGDGKVDAADVADTAALYKNNDIDSDGDGKVDAADVADVADTAALYKNNDIDSDGDGVVDAADTLETGGSTAAIRDTTNALDVARFAEGGNVEIPNGSLTVNTDSVLDPTSLGLTDGGSINSGRETLRGYYDSDGTTSITATSVDASLQHVANTDGSSILDARVQATDVARMHSSGLFEIPNGDLRLATGQSIEDGSGVGRISIRSTDTILSNEAGQDAVVLQEGITHRINAYSNTPSEVKDQEGNFTALQYQTSSSAPGTLSLDNAKAETEASGTDKAGNGDTAIEISSTSGASNPNVLSFTADSNGDGTFGYARLFYDDSTGELKADVNGNTTVIAS